MGEQLQVFSLRRLSVLKDLQTFLREGFWKRSELQRGDFDLLEATLYDLFSD
jgi:hypothetical protein